MEEYVSKAGLIYYHSRVKTVFATQAALTALSGRVDDIVSEGGEPNAIQTISVNGTQLTPDANKNVAITMPISTSDLTNDGDGTSNFATESYVDTNGGKIDVIKINGTAQTIVNKEVDIAIPTAVSDLSNDSGYQTASDVATAINTAIASAYIYKGSVATVADLPASGNTVGDVYNVQATGMNYAWNGIDWDSLGQLIDTSVFMLKTDIEAITTAEIDKLFV